MMSFRSSFEQSESVEVQAVRAADLLPGNSDMQVFYKCRVNTAPAPNFLDFGTAGSLYGNDEVHSQDQIILAQATSSDPSRPIEGVPRSRDLNTNTLPELMSESVKAGDVGSKSTKDTGMYVWIEGPSGTEPPGHESICIGDPRHDYMSYSFGATLGVIIGETYIDPMKGGEILKMKHVDPQDYPKLLKWFSQMPKPFSPDFYGPFNNCRSFSECEFNLAPGDSVVPTQRKPVPWNPLPFSFTTQAADVEDKAKQK